jgi:hypothetical protein
MTEVIIMRQVRITKEQLEEIISSYEDSSYENSYYFDIETGNIELMSDYIEIDEDLVLSIEEALGDRYIRIPKIESYEGYDDMVGFSESIENQKIRDKLVNALTGRKGVFRRFKDVISNYPYILEQWYKYKDMRNRERVVRLFAEEDIELTVGE